MNSRERVLTALEHREPDRVPVDFGGTRVTSTHPAPLHMLRQKLGIENNPIKVMDVWQMLAWVERTDVEMVGGDVLPVPRLNLDFGMRIDHWKPWQIENDLEVRMPISFQPLSEQDGSLILYLNDEPVAKKVPSSPYFDSIIETQMAYDTPDVERIPMIIFDEEELEWRRHWAETLRAETDKALIGDFGSNLGRWSSYQEWLYMLAANPDWVRTWYDRKIENLLTNVELYAQAVGDHIDLIYLMEDFGTQKGLMISPKCFREIIAPYYKRLYNWIHAHTSWKVFFHSCGGIYPIIQDLIDCGIDCLNPIQTNALGMEPSRLKKEFGQQVTFWGGGIDTQSVLPFGNEEMVQEQVKERIGIFAPGGGFVFSTVHNIQYDAPVDNVLAMFEAVHKYGQYPITN
ncbi:MAG: uroporphyrinogen decarboxylase family protein [Anaerolineales bacterium]|jgi:uroporphyrinogen decarboxylase